MAHVKVVASASGCMILDPVSGCMHGSTTNFVNGRMKKVSVICTTSFSFVNAETFNKIKSEICTKKKVRVVPPFPWFIAWLTPQPHVVMNESPSVFKACTVVETLTPVMLLKLMTSRLSHRKRLRFKLSLVPQEIAVLS